MQRPSAGTTRFALRANARLAYDPGSPVPTGGADVPLLLLHDLLADRGAFAAQRASLATRTRVITPDARGHGASATLSNRWYSLAELARDALAILDAEAVASVDIVGHGLGGVVALELARTAPGRVTSVVLIEPAVWAILDGDREPGAVGLRTELRGTDRAAADAAYKGLLDKALEGYLRPRWDPDWRTTVQPARLGAIRRHAGALAGLLPALDAYAPTKPELAPIAVPALVITGPDAPPVVALVADRLARLLPNARATTLPLGPRANQPLAGPAAEPLNGAILEFVNRWPTSR